MDNKAEIPFHARHEDKLLTLDDVAEILQRPPNTVRWRRQACTGPEFLQDRPTALHHRRRPTPLDPPAAARIPARHRPVEGDLSAMDDDLRHVFLHASDVIHRYDWGKTKG
ncbi:MAG: hypothetical protein ACRDPG_04940 [Nocardioidaceae bacterium]